MGWITNLLKTGAKYGVGIEVANYAVEHVFAKDSPIKKYYDDNVGKYINEANDFMEDKFEESMSPEMKDAWDKAKPQLQSLAGNAVKGAEAAAGAATKAFDMLMGMMEKLNDLMGHLLEKWFPDMLPSKGKLELAAVGTAMQSYKDFDPATADSKTLKQMNQKAWDDGFRDNGLDNAVIEAKRAAQLGVNAPELKFLADQATAAGTKNDADGIFGYIKSQVEEGKFKDGDALAVGLGYKDSTTNTLATGASPGGWQKVGLGPNGAPAPPPPAPQDQQTVPVQTSKIDQQKPAADSSITAARTTNNPQSTAEVKEVAALIPPVPRNTSRSVLSVAHAEAVTNASGANAPAANAPTEGNNAVAALLGGDAKGAKSAADNPADSNSLVASALPKTIAPKPAGASQFGMGMTLRPSSGFGV